MTSPSKLYPSADVSVETWAIFGGGPTDIFTAVDEGTDSPNDSDQIASGANANSTYACHLTDTDADFGEATACTVKARGNLGSTKGSYISQCSFRLYKSDGTTALTNSVTQTFTGTTTTYSLTMTISGTPSKADWDGAILKCTTGTGSTGAIVLSGLQVELPYTTAVAGQPTARRLGALGYGIKNVFFNGLFRGLQNVRAC